MEQMETTNLPSVILRFIAYVIDSLVLVAIFMGLGLLVGSTQIMKSLVQISLFGIWWYGGLMTFSWLYYAVQESSPWQATLGKRLMGLKIATEHGRRVSFWRSTVRYVCSLFSHLFFNLGYLMVFFTKKKQTLHDKLTSTFISLQ